MATAIQAERQLKALLEYADVEEGLLQRVAARAVVALPLVHSDDWLEQRGINYFVPSMPEKNMLKLKNKYARSPDAFWHKGAVTVSRIHQAKGNEGDVVYVLGFDNIAKREVDLTTAIRCLWRSRVPRAGRT